MSGARIEFRRRPATSGSSSGRRCAFSPVSVFLPIILYLMIGDSGHVYLEHLCTHQPRVKQFEKFEDRILEEASHIWHLFWQAVRVHITFLFFSTAVQRTLPTEIKVERGTSQNKSRTSASLINNGLLFDQFQKFDHCGASAIYKRC